MTDAILEFFKWLPNEIYVLVISMLPIIELRGAIPVAAVLGMKFFVAYLLAVVGNLLPIPFILLFISEIMDYLYRFKFFKPIIDFLRKKANKHSRKVLVDGPTDKTEMDEPENERARTLMPQDAGSDTAKELSVQDSHPLLNGISEYEVSDIAEADRADAEAAVAEEGYTEPEENTAVNEPFLSDVGDNTVAEEKEPSLSRRAPKISKMPRAVFIALMLFVAIPLPGTGAWTGALVSSLFGLPKRKSFISIALGVLISGVIMSLASFGVIGFLSFLK